MTEPWNFTEALVPYREAQIAAKTKRMAALAVLSEHGIELASPMRFTTEQIEALAGLAGTFTEQEG